MKLLLGSEQEPKVLIVEDDPVSAKLLARALRDLGISSHHARNGREALRLYREHGYRLVLSDWMMPEMGGVDLCRALRALDGPYAYFVVCTSRCERADRLEAFEAGVDDLLGKPIDREELVARLRVADRILGIQDELNGKKESLERLTQRLRKANSRLTQASRRFEELFNGLPVACFTFDAQGVLHEWNREAEQMFGLTAHEAAQRPLLETLVQGTQSEWSEALLRSVFESGEQPRFDWSYQAPDGTDKHLACNIICVRNAQGEAVGAVCANLDITQRKVAEKMVDEQITKLNEFTLRLEVQKEQLQEMNTQLSHLAITDGLTGLTNHRRFRELLDHAVERHQALGQPFSLILLDIDHFKRLNDEFGHPVGDDVLKRFARVLSETSRAHEQPARYGGEEFAVILQKCDEEACLIAAERFRTAILRHRWHPRPLTCSLGVATFRAGATALELLLQADEALYSSKANGRNRTTHFRDLDADSRAA